MIDEQSHPEGEDRARAHCDARLKALAEDAAKPKPEKTAHPAPKAASKDKS